MKLTKYEDLQVFQNKVQPFLEKEEVKNSLPFGVLINLDQASEMPKLMATVHMDDKLSAVFLQSHPRQIIMSVFTSFTPKEITQLAKLLIREVESIPGIIGEKEVTVALAKQISKLKGVQSDIQMDQRIYKLVEVKKAPGQRGKLRLAESGDKPLLVDWVYQFANDINEPISRDETYIKTDDLLKKGTCYVWEVDGKVVSMANAARPTMNNISVNFVYTPIQERKKGYASSCVSALTTVMLDSGYTSTSLYTDLTNPTSNKIYMEIGYQPIMDSIVILFK